MFKKSLRLLIVSIIIVLINATYALTLNDNGRINSTIVSRVIHVSSEADIIEAMRLANSQNTPIAIMGMQHSQGGQSLASKAIELDMLPFNKILSIDVNKKQITVQSGTTWSKIQKYINPYNLAIKSMQSPNIFTVGGSLSVNAHGDDFRVGAVGNSIVSFHFLLADGRKIFVSKDTNPKMWAAVVGGYGFFGVITDVTIQLTDNVLLRGHYQELALDDFTKFFSEHILKDNDTALFYAHLNIVPNNHFLKDLYVITYDNTKKIPGKVIRLDNPDRWNKILTPVFNISRKSEMGKKWRWKLEKRIFKKVYNNRIVTRNNAMEKPVTFASNYQSKLNADWLQEYFIPVNNINEFITLMRPIILENKVNLLNVTIRYVPAEKDILMPYAKSNSFAVVLYFNQDLSLRSVDETKLWTRKLINAALSTGGNYYLPYQNFATEQQFQLGYPNFKKVIELKKIYDPKTRFNNKLYQIYFH